MKVPPNGFHRHHGAPACGFTLLEVLVSIVVLSFGVLGVVGLQAASLQANKEARYQSSGVRLARELADLMRGNKAIANNTTLAANPYLIGTVSVEGATITPLLPTNCMWNTAAAACSPTEIATFEMADWLTRVGKELPGAQVAVCFDDAPYAATGVAQWPCTGSASNIIVIKIGWSRQSTFRGAASAVEKAAVFAPLVVLPVTPGL